MTDIIDFKSIFKFILVGNPRLGASVEKAVSKNHDLGEVFYKGRFSWRHYLPNTPFALNLHRSQTCTNIESLIDAINTDIHYTARDLDKSFYEIMHEHGKEIIRIYYSTNEVDNLSPSDLAQQIGPTTVRQDYLWPTDKNPTTKFFDGQYGLPSTLQKQMDKETRTTIEDFLHHYDSLCGALEKGLLMATGRRHKDAPDILIPADIWGAPETRVDWFGAKIFPTKDDRIVASTIEAQPVSGEAAKHGGGRPPIHPWEQAMPALLEKIARDGLPESGAHLARLLLDFMEPFFGVDPPEEKDAARYLKNKHQSLYEVTVLRRKLSRGQN
ncbi:hypothetical protein J7481_21640 [Labrenzia sp. R4_2]|uniref:hypothetical protein n=1 Tax=Labrenzia sp. R4_2 TaxID=2821107 RepID=UPI001ADD1366|nr:hypothetical protein [Labrenzia sp. R4_2]MBO9422127.1 hypothetical protein [Labrenzia sp. R4_2]